MVLPLVVQSIVMTLCMSACMSFPRAYLKNDRFDGLTNFLVHVACYHGSVLCQHCNTLYASGFLVDVMFINWNTELQTLACSNLWILDVINCEDTI